MGIQTYIELVLFTLLPFIIMKEPLWAFLWVYIFHLLYPMVYDDVNLQMVLMENVIIENGVPLPWFVWYLLYTMFVGWVHFTDQVKSLRYAIGDK